MSDKIESLSKKLFDQRISFEKLVDNKTLEDLGGQQGLNQLLITEICNVYAFLEIFTNLFESFMNTQNYTQEANKITINNFEKQFLKLSKRLTGGK